ncbi:MAG: ribosomal protein S18-alanine N-acetyltransferase [Thermodesulfovibrionia bacterium]|nr:ribosomal protein S18-alanine N-acetyltransferase [Thermodesulfovibrionia bacterium]
MIIRDMDFADLDEVYSIEQESFTTPWSMASFEYELMEEDAILKVAVIDDHIAGYICMRTIADITHILNLAVTPAFRRENIASILLNSALDELRHTQEDVDYITLEVRESSPAVRLYEKHGFKAIGRRKHYYHKPVEDAILMGLEMEELQ